MDDLISRNALLAGIEELKESPWFNFGKADPNKIRHEWMENMMHYGYLQRKEAVEIIIDICIKKETLIKDISDYWNEYEVDRVTNIIEKQPTIEARPAKHGRWINTNNPNHLRCSNCDIIHMIAQYPNGKISYCPNCGSYNGARMDGDSE